MIMQLFTDGRTCAKWRRTSEAKGMQGLIHKGMKQGTLGTEKQFPIFKGESKMEELNLYEE